MNKHLKMKNRDVGQVLWGMDVSGRGRMNQEVKAW
jgi:hypothetical protein